MSGIRRPIGAAALLCAVLLGVPSLAQGPMVLFEDGASWLLSHQDRGYNGDGMLMYPGPDGHPLSSIRLQNIRDGLEDYEYLWLLRRRLDAAEREGNVVPEGVRDLLVVPAEVAADTTHYSTDPGPLHRHRRAIAEAIEGL